MSRDIVSRSLSVHKEYELLAKLEAAGLGETEAQMVIEAKGNELAQKVVAYIRRGGNEATTSQKLARAIMGRNFLGIEEASQHYGVTFTDKQRAQLAEVPFTETTLRECKDTHILVAGFPLSINDVRRKVPSRTLYPQSWYDHQAFARKKVPLEWFLLRKDIVPNSTSQTYRQQLTLLGSNEENPLACQFVYAVALHFLATGERLFRNVYARCQDTTSVGGRVIVGLFDRNGLNVRRYWDGYRLDYIGLAAARKS